MTVIGCTGHQQLPPDALDYIEQRMRELVAEYSDGETLGICSLAVGADQLFARLVLNAGGRLRVIIPANDYSTTFVGLDGSRFRQFMSQATSVHRLPNEHSSPEAYMTAGRQVVDESDLLLAVWDGEGARGPGGTADVVEYAVSQGVRVITIWPHGTTR